MTLSIWLKAISCATQLIETCYVRLLHFSINWQYLLDVFDVVCFRTNFLPPCWIRFIHFYFQSAENLNMFKLFNQLKSTFILLKMSNFSIKLVHGQVNLIKLIWHIFWIKNCNIKFDVYTITLVWSKLIKLASKKWAYWLVGVIEHSSTFLLSENFLSSLE